jgi:hypothetical protein
VARVRAAKGAREKIETYVAALVEIQPRLAPVYLALRDAAATDPDSAATWREISERRARNMRAFAADLRATGELRTDLPEAGAWGGQYLHVDWLGATKQASCLRTHQALP